MTVASLAAGVTHVYGDNGTYMVTVDITDDDDGSGSDTADVLVGNLDPTVILDLGDAVAFPGGDFLITEPGVDLPSSAGASDPGSDDLTFSWSSGVVNIHYNDGTGPDPLPSPFGTFPFFASDQIDVVFDGVGVESLEVTVTDDDGGEATVAAGVLVTGTAEDTEGNGWWKHEYSGKGNAKVDSATLAGYLEIVNAVSTVFSEQTALASAADAHTVLSLTGGNARAKAESALLLAWLQFASGAVEWDATVPLGGGDSIAFLDLLFAAESVILDGGATSAELHAVELDLNRVRHAG